MECGDAGTNAEHLLRRTVAFNREASAAVAGVNVFYE